MGLGSDDHASRAVTHASLLLYCGEQSLLVVRHCLLLDGLGEQVVTLSFEPGIYANSDVVPRVKSLTHTGFLPISSLLRRLRVKRTLPEEVDKPACF